MAHPRASNNSVQKLVQFQSYTTSNLPQRLQSAVLGHTTALHGHPTPLQIEFDGRDASACRSEIAWLCTGGSPSWIGVG